ncbi:hypothetical protein [Gordonia humi]|uniref:Mce-associated membrane protein n=1 Tax=Gordonia humi TaxID=686429 RepID=A0A840EW45_9ACTN|nr:hypothetical protein [Gordonia humi]MBB4134533.1 Mce-associated membrane protein [Gordonia humi]
MVRADHEGGGLLNPEPDGPRKKLVEKSSPLSRRRKTSARRGRESPDPFESGESNDASASSDALDSSDSSELSDPIGSSDPSELSDPGEASDASELSESGEASDASGSTGVETPETDAADAADDTVAVSADDRDRGVSYRARRTSVKAPIGTGSSRGTTLVVVSSVLGALLLVAAIAATIVFSVLSARIDDDQALRTEYDQFAQQAVVNLTTLNPDNADAMLEFMNKHTSGRVLQDMRESMKQATDLIREDDVKTKTTIAASAVEKFDGDSASVLVVFAWHATFPEAPDKPTDTSFRARIGVTRINDELKMTSIDWVD